EDGIRDFHVTGVQTCALPICPKQKSTIDLVLEHPVDRGPVTARSDAGTSLPPLARIPAGASDVSAVEDEPATDTARAPVEIDDEIGRASCRERGRTRGQARWL